MMMILHDKLLPIQKYLMLVLCFVLILYIIRTYAKYLLFAVLYKTEILIYESNIFCRFFRKFSGKYFCGKATSLIQTKEEKKSGRDGFYVFKKRRG